MRAGATALTVSSSGQPCFGLHKVRNRGTAAGTEKIGKDDAAMKEIDITKNKHVNLNTMKTKKKSFCQR